MAQNIVLAWLCGGRFMELKTSMDLIRIAVASPQANNFISAGMLLAANQLHD